jgi:UDP-glucose 4-epimerase
MGTVLITGGCGFIGSTLAAALVQRGEQVRILDDLSTGRLERAPPEADVFIGSVTDVALVEHVMDGVDGCFHLAAVASVPRCQEDWTGTSAINLGGTVAVLSAARRASTPVVYASSAAVYGANPDVPLAEDAAAKPLSAYGADKLASELHARVATLTQGVPTAGFRFFNVYGAGQDPSSPYSGVISIFCDRLRAGRPITVHGDGSQVRDFVHVDDVVAFLIAAMEHPAARPEVFNVCRGEGTSILDLAVTVAEVLGVVPDIRHGPVRSGDIPASIGNPGAAARRFGRVPQTNLQDGLTKMLTAEALTVKDIRRQVAAGTLRPTATIKAARRRPGGGEHRI